MALSIYIKTKTRTVLFRDPEEDTSGYEFFMESPISTNQKIEDDRITYLNKGIQMFFDKI